MAETISVYYHELYAINLELLEMVRQEQWDDFIDLAENYIVRMQELSEHMPSDMTESEKEDMKGILRQLMDNEVEISQKLRLRLNTLQTNISSLHRGAKCTQLYSLQQLASFH